VLILGIESSCDETAAAVVADGERILSSVVASQVLTHARYGGVVPELASREHLRRIVPVVEGALERANVSLADIEAVAVTEGPGLIGSLLVGLVYGKALALSLGKPLVGVNHLEGHLHAVLLQNSMDVATGNTTEAARSACAGLVVSGGHTVLYRMDFIRSAKIAAPMYNYKRLGQTRDDAAGEAFDKVAKLLALGYPGGPVIDTLARFGDAKAVEFGRIKMRGNPRDFSFSGIKTAVLYRVRGSALETEAEKRREWMRESGARPFPEAIREHCSQATLDLIASFQSTVVADLVERTVVAAAAEHMDTVLVSGGVACNSLLRERFAEAAKRNNLKVFFPSPALSTDNAAMIAAAGYHKLMWGRTADLSLTAHASLPLGV
jgi:tRNA N6-adenosine threonylcarbamoyltransferase